VVPKGRFKVYLDRSREFGEQMERAATEGAWNSVGLLGVHCVISACDALTVQRAGQRWSGQDHGGVVGMLEDLHISGAGPVARQVSRVLEAKNRVEYEAREVTEREAQDVRQSASRVISWVSSILPA
jgi:hypothetical protein